MFHGIKKFLAKDNRKATIPQYTWKHRPSYTWTIVVQTCHHLKTNGLILVSYNSSRVGTIEDDWDDMPKIQSAHKGRQSFKYHEWWDPRFISNPVVIKELSSPIIGPIIGVVILYICWHLLAQLKIKRDLTHENESK